MFVLLLAACGTSPAPAPRPEPAPPRPYTPHPQELLDSVVRARDAVIGGKPEDAGVSLGWLVEHPVKEGVPPNLAVHAKALYAAGIRGHEASNLQDVAQSVARVAAACGQCHAAAGAGPTFPGAPIPPGEGTEAHMHRHRWAADQMWDGLVAADTERWQAGAFALLESPLTEADERVPEGAGAWTKRVHELGREGLQASDEATRVELYGSLIATCAACHQEAGEGPEGPTSTGSTP